MEQGFINEVKISNCYNGKTVRSLNDFQKDFIFKLFGPVDEDEVIQSGQMSQMYKPDIFLKIGDKTKFVSIKSGRSDSMHFEGIKSLILYLRSKGVSNDTQKIILLFHYGDGTLDGTGHQRFELNKVLAKMGDKIAKANEELNREDIIEECLYRFVFRGFRENEPCVDAIYYGDEKYGTFAKKDHIIRFVLRKRYEHINTLHIGPMTIQPYLRDVLKVSKHQEKREQIQVKWHYLLTDLQYVNNVAERQHWR